MRLDQHRAPLLEKLVQHARANFVRAHVPGHKGRGGDGLEGQAGLSQVMQIDWTEVPGLDNLHDPQSVIREAEELASACFGADVTRFLVGGSTAGNLAAVLALCQRGDILIVQRDSHQSVLNGIALAGAKAVFLPALTDPVSGLPLPVRTEHIVEALERYPEAKGVFLTCPNYYGIGGNLREVANAVHTYGKPLIVDEAHGAHYGFHPDLPPSALSCGADLVIQSTHKMLTALTMGGMIHLKRGRIPEERLMRVLAMVQSSSPSYPIMASLDLARRVVATSGKQKIERALQAVYRLRDKIVQSGYWELNPLRQKEGITQDPFKLTLRDRQEGRSGLQLQAELERLGCLVEMADPERVLFAFSLMTTPDDTERIVQALTALRSGRENENGPSAFLRSDEPHPSSSVSAASQAMISAPVELLLHPDAPTKRLPLKECIGFRAAETVTPYPPGIPVIYPGETISEAHVSEIERWRKAGARFQGSEDETAQTLTVLAAIL